MPVLDFSGGSKGRNIAFLQKRNGIFVKPEEKSMLVQEGWFNVFIIVTAVVCF